MPTVSTDASTADPGADSELRRGTAYGVVAYGIWGVFPLYFDALRPAGAVEIMAHRILWTLVFCVLVLMVRRDLAWIARIVRRPRLLAGISLAALLIAVNWLLYVLAVITDRTYAAALGYFLNPLVTVALGVVVLRERLRWLQWAAVGVGVAAAIFLVLASGSLPWISLALASSFAGYGLIKKKVGATLPAMHSLTAETAVLAPIAVIAVAVVTQRGEATFLSDGPAHTAIMMASGAITAAPLLLFAAAAARIPLVTVGLIQFISPVMQLLCGVLLLGEQVAPAMWVGFAIVWIALVLLSIDSLTALRGRGRASRQGAAHPPADPAPTA